MPKFDDFNALSAHYPALRDAVSEALSILYELEGRLEALRDKVEALRPIDNPDAEMGIRTAFGFHAISADLYKKHVAYERFAALGCERSSRVIERYNKKVRLHMRRRYAEEQI